MDKRMWWATVVLIGVLVASCESLPPSGETA
ncbi:hypothetical protein QFZ99_006067 [Paraburkholderia atlantica]